MKETDPRILCNQTVKIDNGLIHKERYLEGWHPGKNRLLTMGWTGKETIESYDAIVPAIITKVKS